MALRPLQGREDDALGQQVPSQQQVRSLLQISEAVSAQLRPSSAELGQRSPGHPEANARIELLGEVDALNAESTQALRQGRAEEALQLLAQAQKHLDSMEEPPEGAEQERAAFLRAQADTAGHTGIYHRKKGEHDLAVKSLQRALQFHKVANVGPRTLAAAHLNLAVCFLESGSSPAEGLRHAQAAVELGGLLLATSSAPGPPGSLQESSSRGAETASDDCAMLAVAYHKVAEAYEALRDWPSASHAYSQAYEVVRHGLGAHHHLTKAFEKSSRCPRHLLRSPAAALPSPSCRAKMPARRLPSIPRARPSAGNAHKASNYELGPESFAPWPPPNASREEQKWYALSARKR